MTCIVTTPLELARELGAIEVLRLEITMRAAEPVRLPPFLGSTLRGALASAARRVACALRSEECPGCLLRERCAYSYLFETFRPAGSERLRGHDRVPHPLVLEVPHDHREGFEEGDELVFGVTLFGRAAEHLPYLVVGLDEMARRGIGTRRARFELVRVTTRPLAGDAVQLYVPGEPLGKAPAEPLARHLERRAPEPRAPCCG